LAYIFPSAPMDEFNLWEQAQPWVKKMHGQIPSRIEIQQLTKTLGIDLTTSILYQAILASKRDGSFIQTLKQIPLIVSKQQTTKSQTVKVLIIPAMYFQQHPELGSDGKIMHHVASQLGISTEIIPTLSLGSVQQNAEIIAHVIRQKTCDHLIICTLSKGASDFRLAMERFIPEHAHRIQAWINISGTLHGSACVDAMLDSTVKRLWFKLLCRGIGADYGCLDELRTAHPFWQSKWELPHSTNVINILPLPLIPHVHKQLSKRYHVLSYQGPNDGVMLPHDAIYQAGFIYPVWGCDHFMRTPFIGTLLRRVFLYLLQY